MGSIFLYHGTSDKVVVPTYGYGDEKHDYGKGFYLTENVDLAKEWAVCKVNGINGWVHKYILETDGLKILDFQEKDILSWLAELMRHRDAADSKFNARYNHRDVTARKKMKDLVDSDANKVTRVFSTLFKG